MKKIKVSLDPVLYPIGYSKKFGKLEVLAKDHREAGFLFLEKKGLSQVLYLGPGAFISPNNGKSIMGGEDYTAVAEDGVRYLYNLFMVSNY